jgi:hypothetical protein
MATPGGAHAMTETVGVRVPQRECDLVMKGGITSGVVYPIAIRKIAAEYRFRNLGGASAGAIAAVAAAACEFRRHSGAGDAFDALEAVGTEIAQEGFVQSLFQPRPKARPAFDVGLGVVTSAGSPPGRLLRAAVSILRVRARFLVGATLAVLAWATVVGIAVWALASDGTSTLEVLALVLLGVAALPVAALLVAAIATVGLLHFVDELNHALKETWFGMCSGRTEEGYPEGSGLTDWLYKTIQMCAGLADDQPLTFALLRGDDEKDPLVNLQLVTTDLSASRPVILPLPEPENEPAPYLFDPDEWRKLFPEPVVEHMLDASSNVGPPVEHGPRTLYPVPGFELPVVVAARLSLSFPILLATVPLWRADGLEGELVQHTMSDGGICSNFPIHFFDSLFPGRPTFGLDLQPWRVATENAVEMSDAPRKPGFSRTDGVGTFFTQILNAARNWRDNMQAELPGYRDRICQIRLTGTEGGLNLNMSPEVVKRLVRRGEEAGAEVTNPERFDWDRHRVTRFWILMQMLQRSLGPLGVGRPGVYVGEYPGREPFRNVVERWREARTGPEPPPLDWWERAIPAGDALFELAKTWASEGEVDFDADAPTPTPTLRILPRV